VIRKTRPQIEISRDRESRSYAAGRRERSSEIAATSIPLFLHNRDVDHRLKWQATVVCTVRVSPDGKRLALAIQDDVSIYDFARATLSRLTTNPAHDTASSGRRTASASSLRRHERAIQSCSGGRGIPPAATSGSSACQGSFRSACRRLVERRQTAPVYRGTAEHPVRHRADRHRAPIRRKAACENNFCDSLATVSPDGRWMAYSSFVSGRSEIYVERYPELGNRQLISTGGGDVAVWSRDGRELFFITPDGRPDVCAPGAVRDDARRRASAGVF
jgi:hypothetical protein